MEIENRKSKIENPEEWTIGSLLDWTAHYLARKGLEFPRLDAEVLLAHALGCQRIDLYGLRHGEAASEEIRRQFKELIRRRLEGCPVAYLVGRKEFFSLAFEVSPAVLIPRPDTELVVVECLSLAKPRSEPRIVDIGTGSGAIAVAVAKRHPGARVTAVDLSPAALAVAERNASRHDLAGRVRFLQGDLFDPIPPGERFDFVLSNPPYIATEDLDRLPVGVRDYEPRLALDGGPGGYRVFDRLIGQAREYLARGGYLIVEIGAPQEEPARQRILAQDGYELAETIHDHAGHPRVLRARLADPQR
jgi:release factor glutamine methyltransferase